MPSHAGTDDLAVAACPSGAAADAAVQIRHHQNKETTQQPNNPVGALLSLQVSLCGNKADNTLPPRQPGSLSSYSQCTHLPAPPAPAVN